ncbi:MAG: type II secretion system protein GspM [bacterium]
MIEGLFTQARRAFLRREPRERKLIVGAGAALAALLAWSIVDGMMGSIDRLEREIANGGRRLDKMQALIAEYRDKKKKVEEATPQAGPSSSLTQTVQDLANQAGAQDAVATIRNRPVPPGDAEYKEVAVEMQLKALAQEPLVKLLVGINNSRQHLKVSRLRLDAHGDEGKRLFDVSLTVSRFEAQAGERS